MLVKILLGSQVLWGQCVNVNGRPLPKSKALEVFSQRVFIYLLAFLLSSSCKGSIGQERKLLKSFLFLIETENQKGSCHKSWWRTLVTLAVCTIVSFQRCISLLEATGFFVLGHVLLKEDKFTRQLLRTRLAASFQSDGGT